MTAGCSLDGARNYLVCTIESTSHLHPVDTPLFAGRAAGLHAGLLDVPGVDAGGSSLCACDV